MGKAEQQPETSGKVEHIEFQMVTLSGDVRDEILKAFQLHMAWNGLTEAQQDRLIAIATDIADHVVDRSIDIIATRGCDFFKVKLGKVSFDRGKPISATIEMPFDEIAIGQLAMRSQDTVILVARDAQEFLGERRPAQTDVIGDLKIPVPEQVNPETGEVTAAH